MQHQYTPDQIERFHRSYRKAAEPDGCWEWAAVRAGVYGQFQLAGRPNPLRISAHRMAYELRHGPIPDGFLVRHTCDNRRCVRPDHLLVGTPADNMRDKVERMRHTFGERVNTVRLTEDEVREIRRLSREGWSQHPLARRFGVARVTIQTIVTGKNWKHVK